MWRDIQNSIRSEIGMHTKQIEQIKKFPGSKKMRIERNKNAKIPCKFRIDEADVEFGKTKNLGTFCVCVWIRVPRSIRLRPRYKSAAWHPIPRTGLRGDDGWNRGDRVSAAVADESVFPDEIETDELFVNIDDVDDADRFVNGASAYPLPIKPFCLIGVAKWKPFCCNSRDCGIFRGFGESNDKSEPEFVRFFMVKIRFLSNGIQKKVFFRAYQRSYHVVRIYIMIVGEISKSK